MRIYITGASCAGVTTLGQNLATRLDVQQAAREKQRFGDRIAPGGDMHQIHVAFREWASQYDDPGFSGRNRAWHERWLSEQTAQVLRIDGTRDAQKMAADVIQALPR
ncbi:hypothetical protein IB241_00350 [Pseudomonas sp. PDM05]|jgi:hypothetical protein|uniref:hypothetical protein n=1 Tax=Pseudomonas sp. PDM05 TaxID=2769301 RepID=UPI001782AA28|nr:hypothetical protein [Pseudomonas sp. PDM05]MBD9456126.1 hypothetical protein [Pseudomonas sp. PDM05]